MIFWGIIVCLPWAIFGDAYGISWHSWEYTYSETLNIQIGGAVLETVIWGILLLFSVGMIVAVFAEKEEKKESFKPFF